MLAGLVSGRPKESRKVARWSPFGREKLLGNFCSSRISARIGREKLLGGRLFLLVGREKLGVGREKLLVGLVIGDISFKIGVKTVQNRVKHYVGTQYLV